MPKELSLSYKICISGTLTIPEQAVRDALESYLHDEQSAEDTMGDIDEIRIIMREALEQGEPDFLEEEFDLDTLAGENGLSARLTELQWREQ